MCFRLSMKNRTTGKKKKLLLLAAYCNNNLEQKQNAKDFREGKYSVIQTVQMDFQQHCNADTLKKL